MKRYIIFLVGLIFLALGIAITAVAGLGTSPISSPPYIFSERFFKVSFGTTTFVWNAVMVFFQIILLRKKFRPFLLIQLPVALLLGVLVDAFGFCVSFMESSVYPIQFGVLILGCVVSGFGIGCMVLSERVISSAEGLVQMIAEKYGKQFGTVKVWFDIANVVLGVIMCLAFFGDISRIREGTLINALITGFIAQGFCNLLAPVSKKFIGK